MLFLHLLHSRAASEQVGGCRLEPTIVASLARNVSEVAVIASHSIIWSVTGNYLHLLYIASPLLGIGWCSLPNRFIKLSCTPAADVKKAKEGGFHTVQSLIMTSRKVSHCRPDPCWQPRYIQCMWSCRMQDAKECVTGTLL